MLNRVQSLWLCREMGEAQAAASGSGTVKDRLRRWGKSHRGDCVDRSRAVYTLNVCVSRDSALHGHIYHQASRRWAKAAGKGRKHALKSK